ncbi:PIG-L deacetylase family protein [Streptomyces indicus]|uniref:N-acetylglucosaminyl deacetylase, LmbE family n=1 Tax=Streptomyces indicus TaxID=417292 RepID=A0A1G8TRI8_9ACTN|nr:PIG-L deacetylase family protein [Streptomyces indicus]SDJ44043.1 N-acetylglucosaminyl deacetylase, LmbE family [Streptomyces indicus]
MAEETQQLAPMPEDWQRALAVVAHPDDLEYGCAGAIAQWTDAGKEVVYLLATRGEAGIDTLEPDKCGPLREQEQLASAAAVGVQTVEFLDHKDGVIEYGTALRRDIAAAIRRHRPELVITLNHHESFGGRFLNTPDHRAVGQAAIDAVGDAGNRWIFPELGEQGLAPWGGVKWIAIAGSDTPTHAIAAEPGFERAVASLLEHRAYIEALTDEDPEAYARGIITMTSSFVGDRFGGKPAIGFHVYER